MPTIRVHTSRLVGSKMQLRTFAARRFERVLEEGRTYPLVLGCGAAQATDQAPSKVVKAIGCPEVTCTRSMVCEIVGNAVARRMGVPTPEPCLVALSPQVADSVNEALRSAGFEFRVQSGEAAGCELLRLAPYSVGQALSTEQRTQAAKLYVFDMLSQNTDRRALKVNCGLTKSDLVAFDFETCFQHLFLPIVGGLGGEHWEPSKCIEPGAHLFHGLVKTAPPGRDAVAGWVAGLSPVWWEELYESLPDSWRHEALQIWGAVRQIAEHSAEFANDINRSLM